MIIKPLSSKGQITLGKEFAGRLVTLDQPAPGIWAIKLGAYIPANEKWLHTPKSKASLDRALAWAARNPPRETNLTELEARLFAKTKARTAAAKRKRAA